LDTSIEIFLVISSHMNLKGQGFPAVL